MKRFLDTNVFLYAFLNQDVSKKAVAARIVADAVRTGNGRVSVQVVLSGVPAKPPDPLCHAAPKTVSFPPHPIHFQLQKELTQLPASCSFTP